MIEGTLAVASGSALIALPLLGPYAIEAMGAASQSTLALQIVMQGIVGGLISVVALIGAVRTLPAQVAAQLPVFTPVVALGLAYIAFGTIPSTAEILGALIIATGFVMSLGVLNARGLPRPRIATRH
ncbi:hypothetical protein ACERZ8_20670 [Tateyamaria armeniaca]|uniref:EamA domain-containing protein n=1 Tax=Tateyamaria armeniaca TaxID=2518930 RepID=A0ABW8UYZ7_9RHOB